MKLSLVRGGQRKEYLSKMNDKVYPGLHPSTRQKLLKDKFIFNDEDQSINKVVEAVCTYFKTEPAFILDKSNKPDAARPRLWVYYLSYEHYKLRKVSIAEKLGKNHATIISGIKKIQGELSVYSHERRVLLHIKELLKKIENGSL